MTGILLRSETGPDASSQGEDMAVKIAVGVECLPGRPGHHTLRHRRAVQSPRLAS